MARKDSMARKLHILYKAYIRLFMNIWEYEWTNRWINSVFRDMLLEVMRPSLLDKKGVLVERPSIINLYPKNLSLGQLLEPWKHIPRPFTAKWDGMHL